MSYDPDKLHDPDYTLGVLCSEFFEKFGENALEIISRTCRQRGMALGRRFAAKQVNKSFQVAIKAFVAASEKSRAPAKLLFLEENRAIVQGTVCPMWLNGRGRNICEAMMTMDQAIIEEASGKNIKVTVNRTLAAGDDCCEVIFEAE